MRAMSSSRLYRALRGIKPAKAREPIPPAPTPTPAPIPTPDTPPVAPVNTVAPSASEFNGRIDVTPGEWANSPTSFFYEFRSGSTVLSYSQSPLYTRVAPFLYAPIFCRVSAVNAGGAATADSNSLSVAEPAPTPTPTPTPTPAPTPVAVPTNTVLPALSGNAAVGSTLSLSDGTWTGSPGSYNRQFLRNGVAIAGATSGSYLLTSTDQGATIGGTVTALNAGGSSSPASAATVGPIASAPRQSPVNQSGATITGTAKVGYTLMTSTGVWTNTPDFYNYQWKSGGVNVGSDQNTYLLVSTDEGKTITCLIKASNSAGFGTNTGPGVGPVQAADIITTAPAPTPTPTPTPTTTGQLVGVNIAMAEFGHETAAKVPGVLGTDYAFPGNATLDYFTLTKGMKSIRLPFEWGRVQVALNGDLNPTNLVEIDRIVTRVTANGSVILLDCHNYMRRFVSGTKLIIANDTVSTLNRTHLADFWSKMANRYKGNPLVWFNLMNEPHDLGYSNAGLAEVYNVVIAAIRATGATNKILVSGNHWSGGSAWGDSGHNAAMLTITDSGNNFAFDVHQYNDSNYSGNPSGTLNTTPGQTGADRLVAFTQWARTNGRKGFLGEYAGQNTAEFKAAVTAQLDYMKANSDVWLGSSWWAGGEWWGGYAFSIQPSNGVDKPQMAWLTPYI